MVVCKCRAAAIFEQLASLAVHVQPIDHQRHQQVARVPRMAHGGIEMATNTFYDSCHDVIIQSEIFGVFNRQKCNHSVVIMELCSAEI